MYKNRKSPVPRNGKPLKQQASPSQLVTEHYRCPEQLVDLAVRESLSADSGYFRFGDDVVCFGQCASVRPGKSVSDFLYDCNRDISIQGETVRLPFDPVQVVNNLRYEYYKALPSADRKEMGADSTIRRLYYFVRPLFPVGFRKYLQRYYFRGWERIRFPRWPVDFTSEKILEQILVLSMRAHKIRRLPFIWFWPDGAPSCAIMTHDVETAVGRDFCGRLMDINDSFGVKSAFQIIPEERYEVPQALLDAIPARGFELNVHDLNHDGHLTRSREGFLARAKQINEYGRRFKASGFRSAMLHRKLDWYDALDFSYDMSVPNVAHLDPQRGGCCTIFPFFNGKLLELPVTMTQDYSLFHILQDYSLDLWKQQVALVMQNHGLMNFIVHPDYIIGERECKVYEALLRYLKSLEDREGVWLALPKDVDRWWRQRAQMRLVNDGSRWSIQGQGSERARIAYATEEDGKLIFEFDENTQGHIDSQGQITDAEIDAHEVPAR